MEEWRHVVPEKRKSSPNDLRRSKQDDLNIQQAINKRNKVLSKYLSDLKLGKIPKEKIVKQITRKK